MTTWKRPLGCLTRDEQERLDDASDVRNEDVTAGESRHPVTGDSSGANSPGGQVPASPSPAPVPHSSRPRSCLTRDDIRRVLVQIAVDAVWEVADHDHGESSRWLEALASGLQEHADQDRRTAIRQKREAPPPPNRIERAREELRGVDSGVDEFFKDVGAIWMKSGEARPGGWDRLKQIEARLHSALALLEEVGR